jgi:hypothetical protein
MEINKTLDLILPEKQEVYFYLLDIIETDEIFIFFINELSTHSASYK